MKDYAVDPIDGAQADRNTRDNSLSLLHFTADLTRREADLLRFPVKPEPERHDPLAYAVRNIDSARADLEFAIAEAWNSGDVAGMAQLVEHIVACADGLLVLETMAKDLSGRMETK